MKVSRQHDATGAKYGNPKIKVWELVEGGSFGDFLDQLIGVFYIMIMARNKLCWYISYIIALGTSGEQACPKLEKYHKQSW